MSQSIENPSPPSRDAMQVPDLVQEQWRIQAVHMARLSRARRAMVVGCCPEGPVAYAADRPIHLDLSGLPQPHAGQEAGFVILRTGRWYRPRVRCRVLCVLWPDGRPFGYVLLLCPRPRPRPRPDLEDSYRFLVEETLRLGLQAAKSKTEAGYEKLSDPLHRDLFCRMVCRCMADKRIALLSIGVDNGVPLREQYGRPLEAQALAVLSRRMISRIRGTDLICRLEDGRFLALMRQADSLQHVACFTQKLLSAAREDIHLDDRIIRLQVSIGVAFNKDTVQGYEQLVRQAHAAMYQARRAGGDRFVIFNPDMR